jgi:hypothetical protein
MKKISVILVALLLICGFTAVSFAQEAAGTSPDATQTQQANNSNSTKKPKKHTQKKKHHKKNSTRKVGQL